MLFEAQVERTPEAVALVFQGEELSYQELNRRANQLAHHLQRLGVGPEVLVGICVERSPEMVVGLLGILKAGGAYVPLDPGYPAERISFMLEDAQVAVLLTQQGLSSRLPAHRARKVCLDTDADLIARQPASNPLSRNHASQLVYVIYTSGSTGRPKGVAIEHRSTVAFISWALSVFSAEDLAGVLASTSICFDLSVFEIFVPLSSGGTVILVENLLHLPALVSGHPVTLVNTVPSLLAEVLHRASLPESVRTVNLAGEPLRSGLVRQLYRQETIRQVFNLYGPTEDTTYSTFALVEPGEEGEPSIGRPIANTQVYILDEQMHLVPVGVPGELYLGGAGLARGYLNRAELTAERFVANPFAQEAAARLYKTGDRARYLPDGNIECLGRLDHQVKIRGFRVELGEIEAVLSQHPAVREAVVVAHEQEPGEKRLVAYVVLAGERAASTSELREQVLNALPVYMVPSAFVELEALPLTPNGKVDRRGLPAPEPITRAAGEPYVAPTLMEHYQLIQIWEELLDVRPISIRDNFFYVGGHSLLAARLVERIEQTFGKKLPLDTLFAGPTIEQLAQALQAGAQQHSRTSLVAVQAGGSMRPFFYLHGAWESDAFYCFHLAQHLGPDQPFYALKPYAFDSSGALPTIEEMAAAHLRLVRSVQPQGPYLLGGFCNGGLVAYEMAWQLQAQGQRVDQLVLVEPAFPPVLHALARGVIHRVGALPRLSQEWQCTCFLRLRHIYKYLRRQRSAETLKAFRRIDPSIHALFPTAEALRQDDYALYDWIITGYTLPPYPGEISLIWAREEPFHGMWHKAARAHNVALDDIPGTHISCRTDHVGAFAEQLGRCLDRVRGPGSKESGHGESIPVPVA
jgi:amino acid adenylation domain-containing protein